MAQRSGLLFYSSLVDRNEADFIVEKAYLKIEPAETVLNRNQRLFNQ